MFGVPAEILVWFAAGMGTGLFLAMLVFATVVMIERRALQRRLRIARTARAFRDSGETPAPQVVRGVTEEPVAVSVEQTVTAMTLATIPQVPNPPAWTASADIAEAEPKPVAEVEGPAEVEDSSPEEPGPVPQEPEPVPLPVAEAATEVAKGEQVPEADPAPQPGRYAALIDPAIAAAAARRRAAKAAQEAAALKAAKDAEFAIALKEAAAASERELGQEGARDPRTHVREQ